MYSVYFIRSIKNNKVYVGRTEKKPDIRVKEHNLGTNVWTRQNGPFKMIYYESFACKEDAIKKEAFYKSGVGRRIKSAIIKEMDS